MANAAVQVTDEVDLSKVNDLRADTTGDITVDIVSDLKANLTAINNFVAEEGVAGDVILSTSDIKVTDVVNKSEAETINAYNDQGGTVTLTSVTDLLNNVNDLSTTAGISISKADLKVAKALNNKNRMTAMVNKLINKSPTALDEIKFGIVNKPLSEFTNVFEAGLLKAGDYINGELLDAAANTSNMDAGSYNPETAQDTVVDAGLYINV